MTRPLFKLKHKGLAVVPPPVLILNASSYSVSEGVEFFVELVGDHPNYTWTIPTGADHAKFSLGTRNNLYGLILPPKVFASPDDADANGSYIVDVVATNPLGYTGTKTITVSLTQAAVQGAVQMRPTQTAYVDTEVAAALSTAPDTGLITVTVTGAVDCVCFPEPYSTWRAKAGQTIRFRKKRLLGMLYAESIGAADGATGYWDFTWSGLSSPKRIDFTINQYPTTLPAMTVGARDFCGYGKNVLGPLLPGNIANWTIKTQTKNGVGASTDLAIWPDNHCLTWADSSGGTASNKYGTTGTNRKVGTSPTIGDDIYTVVLQNIPEGLADRTVHVNVSATERGVAPNPVRDIQAGQFNQLVNTVYSALYYGDTIWCARGSYNPNGGTFRVNFDSNSVRSVNPATSVQPLDTTDGPYGGGNKTYDGVTVSNRWITVMPTEPLGADIGLFGIDLRGTNSNYVGFRWRWMNLDNVGSLPFVRDTVGAFYQWVMIDRCSMKGLILSNKDTNKWCFYLRSIQHDTTQGFYLAAQNSQCIGNIALRIFGDSYDVLCWNSTYGTRWSQFRWNICLEPVSDVSVGTHGDMNQYPAGTGAMATLDALPDGTIVEIMDEIGNQFMRTKGRVRPGGYDEEDQQGFNGTGFAGIAYLVRQFGNMIQCGFDMGCAVSSPAPGSYIRNMTLWRADYALNGDPNETPLSSWPIPPSIWIESTVNPALVSGGLAIVIDHCVINAIKIGAHSTAGWAPTPTQTANVVTPVQTNGSQFVGAMNGNSWQRPEDWLGDMTPVAGSKMVVGGVGAPGDITRTVGACGNAAAIDHEAWTFDPALAP